MGTPSEMQNDECRMMNIFILH